MGPGPKPGPRPKLGPGPQPGPETGLQPGPKLGPKLEPKLGPKPGPGQIFPCPKMALRIGAIHAPEQMRHGHISDDLNGGQ